MTDKKYYCILCGESEESHCREYVETFLNPPIIHEKPRFKVGEIAIAEYYNYVHKEKGYGYEHDGIRRRVKVRIIEIRPKIVSNVWEYVFKFLETYEVPSSYIKYGAYGYDNLEMKNKNRQDNILLFKEGDLF